MTIFSLCTTWIHDILFSTNEYLNIFILFCFYKEVLFNLWTFLLSQSFINTFITCTIHQFSNKYQNSNKNICNTFLILYRESKVDMAGSTVCVLTSNVSTTVGGTRRLQLANHQPEPTEAYCSHLCAYCVSHFQ